jgi:hypothetical protein
MEPTVFLRITRRGVVSVRIRSETEKQERAALALYEKIRPVISFTAALLIKDQQELEPGLQK